MAVLWTNDAAGGWSVLNLAGSAVALPDDPAAPIKPVGPQTVDRRCRLMRFGQSMHDAWVLLLSPDATARVNGERASRIRVLNDKDRIESAGREYYFSTEQRAQVETLGAGAESLACPRCKS